MSLLLLCSAAITLSRCLCSILLSSCYCVVPLPLLRSLAILLPRYPIAPSRCLYSILRQSCCCLCSILWPSHCAIASYSILQSSRYAVASLFHSLSVLVRRCLPAPILLSSDYATASLHLCSHSPIQPFVLASVSPDLSFLILFVQCKTSSPCNCLPTPVFSFSHSISRAACNPSTGETHLAASQLYTYALAKVKPSHCQ